MFFQVKKLEVDKENVEKINEEIASKFFALSTSVGVVYVSCNEYNSCSMLFWFQFSTELYFPTGFNLSLQSKLEGSKDNLLKKVRAYILVIPLAGYEMITACEERRKY